MFWSLSERGKILADLHVNYESAPEYPLGEEWDDEGLDFRVEKMKLLKTVATHRGRPPQEHRHSQRSGAVARPTR